MADLDEKQSSQSTKVIGANPSTGIESDYLDVDSAGRVTIKLNDGFEFTKDLDLVTPADIETAILLKRKE